VLARSATIDHTDTKFLHTYHLNVREFAFSVKTTDGGSRLGECRTAHGVFHTPAFMPVGTQGTVKALRHCELEDAGAEIMLSNTYHLLLRPGDELIARRGGLHRFIGWNLPILTDSGGYQVFSLADRCTITEEGADFRSHLDGARQMLTPERATDVQARLGSDIAMVLDECLAFPATHEAAASSMRRSIRWAERGRRRMMELRGGDVDAVQISNPGQAQFGIVQGGVFGDLRAESADSTAAIGFEGYAIGGLSVGEPVEVMYDIAERACTWLPENRPRYLMGTGTPLDLVECVARGIDMFDCVMPTRNARNGQLFTRTGSINIKNAAWAEDERPPDEACRCYTCRTCSRAYLRHLYIAGEMTAATLNTLHNVQFYLDTMGSIREAIEFGSFEGFRQAFHQAWSRRPSRP
jgi:queuine tRNA-ribosyltransferase